MKSQVLFALSLMFVVFAVVVSSGGGDYCTADGCPGSELLDTEGTAVSWWDISGKLNDLFDKGRLIIVRIMIIV